MRIDIHAHYSPAEYLDTLDRFGSDATAICRDLRAGVIDLIWTLGSR